MKKILIGLLLIPSFISSQNQISYKIERDDPNNLPWISTNLDLFSLDIPVNNSNAISFYTGLWGYVKPFKVLPVTVDYNVKRSYLVLGAIGDKAFPKTWVVGVGGRFNLLSTIKKKKTKVVLDSKSVNKETLRGKKEVIETTFIKVNAKRHTVLACRGGLYLRTRGYSNDDIEAMDFTSKLNSNGFYGGVMLSSYKNVFIKSEKYGKSAASKGIDLYADAILAKNTFVKVSDGQEITQIAKDNLKRRTPIGLRIGLQTYEIEKKVYTDKMFGMNYNFEVGILPYEGIYFQGGITLTLLKIKK